MSAKHPALISFYDETGADFRANVETLDPNKISAERRAELLTIYASDEVIKRLFERALMDWSARFEARGAQIGEQIRADIWTCGNRATAATRAKFALLYSFLRLPRRAKLQKLFLGSWGVFPATKIAHGHLACNYNVIIVVK